ncbi:MAG: hypothetical protein N2485_06935 [bacterium]|nr:hypothetical protein [bacterium]
MNNFEAKDSSGGKLFKKPEFIKPPASDKKKLQAGHNYELEEIEDIIDLERESLIKVIEKLKKKAKIINLTLIFRGTQGRIVIKSGLINELFFDEYEDLDALIYLIQITEEDLIRYLPLYKRKKLEEEKILEHLESMIKYKPEDLIIEESIENVKDNVDDKIYFDQEELEEEKQEVNEKNNEKNKEDNILLELDQEIESILQSLELETKSKKDNFSNKAKDEQAESKENIDEKMGNKNIIEIDFNDKSDNELNEIKEKNDNLKNIENENNRELKDNILENLEGITLDNKKDTNESLESFQLVEFFQTNNDLNYSKEDNVIKNQTFESEEINQEFEELEEEKNKRKELEYHELKEELEQVKNDKENIEIDNTKDIKEKELMKYNQEDLLNEDQKIIDSNKEDDIVESVELINIHEEEVKEEETKEEELEINKKNLNSKEIYIKENDLNELIEKEKPKKEKDLNVFINDNTILKEIKKEEIVEKLNKTEDKIERNNYDINRREKEMINTDNLISKIKSNIPTVEEVFLVNIDTEEIQDSSNEVNEFIVSSLVAFYKDLQLFYTLINEEGHNIIIELSNSYLILQNLSSNLLLYSKVSKKANPSLIASMIYKILRK